MIEMTNNRKFYVYIAGPYSRGDLSLNIRAAAYAAEQLTLLGYIPFIPHTTTFLWHTLYPHGLQFWYDYDLAWLEKCDVLLRLDGESPGADKEVAFALSHNIPVVFSLDNLPTL